MLERLQFEPVTQPAPSQFMFPVAVFFFLFLSDGDSAQCFRAVKLKTTEGSLRAAKCRNQIGNGIEDVCEVLWTEQLYQEFADFN